MILTAVPVAVAALAQLVLAWRLRAAVSGLTAVAAGALAIATAAGSEGAQPLLVPAVVLLVLGAGLLWIGQIVQRALDED